MFEKYVKVHEDRYLELLVSEKENERLKEENKKLKEDYEILDKFDDKNIDDYKKLEEENKRLKEENKKLEEKNKTFEDYNKYLNNQLDKLEENKKLKEVNQAVKNIIKKNSIPVKENYNDYYEDTPKEDKKIEKLEEFDIQGIEVSGYSMTQAEYLLEQGIQENRDKINEIIDKINGE